MDARNGLHAPSIPVAQAHAIHAFGASDVGRAVHADGDGLIGWQPARHARHPQHLVAQCRQFAVNGLVDQGQLVQAGVDSGMHTGHQFKLRFAEIRSDVWVRQWRPQRRRMRR